MSLTPYKRPKSPYYYARGTIEGRKIFVSTKRTGLQAAKEQCHLIEVELRRQKNLESIKLFFEAVDVYIQKGGEQTYLAKINKALGLTPLNEINQEIIDQKGRETYPGVKDSTLRRRWYTPISAILNHAADLGWCSRLKIKKPKEKRPPPEWVELDWLGKLWDASNDKVKALTTFLPYTGCRIGECLDLTWDRVNLKEGWAYIPKTKNKDHRTVPLAEVVIDALKRIEKNEGRVFEFKNRHAAVLEIRRACKRAKITYKRPHIIGSHTYATMMRRYQGLDARGLMATGRWKDPRSTFIYTHIIPGEDAKKALNLPGAKRAKSVQKKKKRRKSKRK